MIPAILFAQMSGEGIVTGKVVDMETGDPLPGANVYIKGYTLGAPTDLQGNYKVISVPVGRHTLVVSYLGYETREFSIQVESGRAVSQNAELSGAVLQSDEVVVTGGIRQGQARALNQQKTANNIKNVVSSDLVGRFPDPNAAEALQRMPAISIERDQGEGRYVLIRGMEARLNSVSINGERLPAPEGSIRSVALDVIPADVVSSIEVSKAITPDMDGDAIGGAINLVTKSARDYERSIIKATLAGGRNQIVEDSNFQGALTLGKTFRDGKLGVLFSGSHYNTNRGSDNNEFEYSDENFGSGDVWALEDYQMRDYVINRKRTGLAATIDYELSDQETIYIRGMYNDFSDDEQRHRSRYRPGKGDFLSEFSSEDAELERELKDRYEAQKIYGLKAGGNHIFDNLLLDYALSFTYAEEEEPDRLDATFVQDEVAMTWNRNDYDNPVFSFSQGDPYDYSNYYMDELVIENNLTTDQDIALSLNLELPHRIFDRSSSLKFGGKFRGKTKDRENNVDIYSWDDDFGDLTLAQVLGSHEDTDFLEGKYRIGRVPDPAKSKSHFLSNINSGYEFEEGDSRIDTDEANYDATENIYAGYAMETIDFDKLRLIVGARVEMTDLEYTGNEVIVDEDGDYLSTSKITRDDNYTDVLPMVHFRFSHTENTIFRGAFTTTIARPNYFDLVPYRNANREEEEVSLGNSSLTPTRSLNLDFMGEHYFQPLGVISAGVFYKQLNDYIYPSYRRGVGGDFDGWDITQPVNGDAATLFGFEVNVQQQLTMLPGNLNGLGLYFNYTYTDSEADFPLGINQTRAGTLPGQSEHMANFAVSYEKFGFSGRVSMNYHGKFLAEVADNPDEDIYYDSATQWDFSATQRITDNIRLFGEILNLSDQPLRYYKGVTSRPIQREFYKWWGHFGIKFDL